MHEIAQVCGVASPPLKDESALSVMLRIASSNALTHKQTLALLLDRRVSSCELDLLRIDISKADAWGRGIGWQWQPAEAKLIAAMPGLNRVLWSRQTRWCPVCAGFGFHSIWFQLAALATCPIHGCPLIDHCEACGVETGPYKVSKALFNKPYHCRSCGTSIARGERSGRERWIFFRQAEAFKRAFDPLARWYGGATRELIFLDVSCRKCQNSEVPAFKAGLLDGAMRKLVPLPSAYALSPVRRVQLRSWNMRLARDVSRDGPPSRYGLLSAGTALSVYQSTTRFLLHMVAQQVSTNLSCESLQFHNGEIASVEGWTTGRLALVIMRCFFEAPFFLTFPAPIGGSVLRSSVFAPAIMANYLLKVNCRAMVLATFLATYEMAAGYINRGYILRRDLFALPEDFVVLVGTVSAGVLDAVVTFPETELTDLIACGEADSATLAATTRSLNASFADGLGACGAD